MNIRAVPAGTLATFEVDSVGWIRRPTPSAGLLIESDTTTVFIPSGEVLRAAEELARIELAHMTHLAWGIVNAPDPSPPLDKGDRLRDQSRSQKRRLASQRASGGKEVGASVQREAVSGQHVGDVRPTRRVARKTKAARP